MPSISPAEPAARHWRRAGRALVEKMLSELAFEGLLVPEPAASPHCWRLRVDGGAEYRFRARRGPFGAWRVEPGSVWRDEGEELSPGDDPVRLALDARALLAPAGPDACELVRELTATQAADARLLVAAPTAAELADLPYADLEGHGSGHPCIVLNKGRLGFSAADAARYAPEGRRPIRLLWLAVHRRLCEYASLDGLDQPRLLEAELGDGRRRLGRALDERGADAASYLWMPVHPWHWDEAIAPLFAAEIAGGGIVPLGEGDDRYRSAQSVRTLINVDAPGRHDVKLPLLVRNTLVWRGLARAATAAAPDVTAWLERVRERDPHLRDDCRFALLGEVASVVGGHPALDAVPDAPYRYHELLGAVWREPVAAHLENDERARTMASLLWVGSDGRPLVAELVRRSGLGADDWLARLVAAVLRPLLHCLVRYGVAFCPHGENTVIVYDGRDVPVRIAVKDLAEDVNLLPDHLPEHDDLPPRADAVLLRWDARMLRHSLLSAVLVGHFRYLSELMERHLGLPEARFWEIVREEVLLYPRRFPQLAERFAAFNLLAPSFERVCLNREQLLGQGFHERAERDESFDVMHGRVPNPLAG